MSREIRRVPVDFDWPLKKTWDGYLLPEKFHEKTCMQCFGRGKTPAAQWIGRIALMLDQLIDDLDQQAKQRPMHPWLVQDTYPPTYTEYGDREVTRCEVVRPTAEILEFAQALVKDDEYERSRTIRRGPMASNRDAIARGLLRTAGLPEKWAYCPNCHGHGTLEVYEGQRAEGEAWEQTDPPSGDGWQLWETVSEGSPISPVFDRREGMVGYLMSDANRWGISRPLSRTEAEAFVDAGSSFGSLVVVGGQMIPGDAAVLALSNDSEGEPA